MPNKLKADQVLLPKKAPRFEVVDPKLINEKSRNQSPQYKYVTEMMNEMNPEEVFRKLLDQPVTMKLGEILGSSYELGKQFQTATSSQCFAVPQNTATPIEVVCRFLNQEEEDDSEL